MINRSEQLRELAERCEKAEGPDRGLDGWIYAHMTRGESYVIGNKPGRFPQEPIYGERIDVMRQLSGDPEGAAQYIGAPDYTASIDTALTLLAGLPWLCPIMDFSERTVRLVNGIGLPVAGDDHLSRGETMALALCAAALRSQSTQEGAEQ